MEDKRKFNGGHTTADGIAFITVDGVITEIMEAEDTAAPSIEALTAENAELKASVEALTAEKKKEWLDNITVATRNLVVLNLILNRVTPLSAQLRDTKSLSLAAKTSGMVTINSELFDLVEAIRKVDPTVSNAYEQAFALWTAENPGKAVYSISRDSKEVKVLLSQTKEFKILYFLFSISLVLSCTYNSTAVGAFGPVYKGFLLLLFS